MVLFFRQAAAQEPAFIGLGAGWYDFLQRDDDAVDFRLEYRHDRGLWFIKPWIGVEATTEGAVYGVGGILIDIFLGRRLAVTPSIGIGAYSEGNGKDLGSAFEVRSQIEVAYRLEDRSRLGIAFSHTSNASTADSNPGVEVLTIYYLIPLDRLFGKP
jgi:hypothetical protein